MEDSPKNSAFQKHVKMVRKFSDPQTLAGHIQENTQELSRHLPNITQGLATTVMNAHQFLQSKLPIHQNPLPLSPAHNPSNAEKAKFEHYFHAVNDPLSLLDHVKNGTLRSEHMEAAMNVFPHLLDEMRKRVMEHMNLEKAKELPYQRKLALAHFMGQPLDGNMTAQAIGASQAAIARARQQNQQALKPTVDGMKNLGVAKRSTTETQEEIEEK